MRTSRHRGAAGRVRRDERAEWEALAGALAAVAWRWRVELGLVGLTVAVSLGVGAWLGGAVAGAVVAAAVGGLLAVRPARHRTVRLLADARVRAGVGARRARRRGRAGSASRPARAVGRDGCCG